MPASVAAWPESCPSNRVCCTDLEMNAPLRPAEWVLDLNEPIVALAGSPDGRLIAALGTEGSAWVVEASTGRRLPRQVRMVRFASGMP
jgi:hypothetical protein